MTVSDIIINYEPVEEKKFFEKIPEQELFSFKKKRMRRLALCQIDIYLKKASFQPKKVSLYCTQINLLILHESLLKISKIMQFFTCVR